MAHDHNADADADADADAVAAAAAECQHLTPSSPTPNSITTWEGCSVLLDINDGDRLVFARLSPAATLKIGNKKCSLGPLLGCPFGSLFRVGNGPGGPCLSRCSHSTSGASDNALQAIEEESIAEGSRDNRLLIDNNTAQNLSSDDIDAMRRNGATGDEIVEALISNSATFEKKTVYSQEKYKRKKQKKYAPKVLLRKPSALSICETYFKKFPARIGFLRVDTLSLLLSMTNVGAHSNVLVVDIIGGMVTGAVAERLGGTGYVCSTYFGATPYPSDIIRMFNFNREVYSRIVHVPVSDLSKSLDDFVPSEINAKELSMPPESAECRNSVDISEVPIQGFDFIKEKSLNDEQPSVIPDVGESQHVASSLCPSGANDLELGHDTPMSDRLVNKGSQAPLETMKQWKTNGFSGLIVAAPESEVGTIVHKLLPLLAYSAPFAIYHQYLQPLATCMHNLQTSKVAISLQISEPWLREYQVLPSRTHPVMQMSSFGGYILSGIRIRNSVPGSI